MESVSSSEAPFQLHLLLPITAATNADTSSDPPNWSLSIPRQALLAPQTSCVQGGRLCSIHIDFCHSGEGSLTARSSFLLGFSTSVTKLKAPLFLPELLSGTRSLTLMPLALLHSHGSRPHIAHRNRLFPLKANGSSSPLDDEQSHENGHWVLPDIKRAYGKIQRSRANTNRDGLSVILVKQIQQHLQKCETDKLLRENKAEKAKVRALAEQLQNEKEDKERLLNEKAKLLNLLSKRLESKDFSGKKSHSIRSSSKAEQEFLYPFSDLQKNEDQQDLYLLGESDSSSTVNSDSDVNTHDDIIKDNLKVRLAPVIVKNRRTEVEIDNEEEYEENGERQTRTVTKVVKKSVPHRTYQPATPEQVDKWSKDLPDVYKQPRKAWQFLQRLQKIYNLHPLDGVMIVNVNLRDNDQKRLTESVERWTGESQANIEVGWEAVRTFLFELKPAEVNWAKITSCMQKTRESVAEYEERFIQIWLEYAGVNNNEDLSKDTSMPLKTAFVNGLKPEISKALKIRYDDWDSIGTAFMQIVEWSAKIERTQEVNLRALQTKTLSFNNRTTGYEEHEYVRYPKAKSQGRCRYCNEEGHWVRDCKLILTHQSDDDDDDNLLKRFQLLTDKQKQTLLKAFEPQEN
ncbi:uncharacterized protein LOC125266168 [Megalobrama amblycephala]|uniref:uncharacterized protein LOC125266168 n=1 Tax=Megalobrama amblycephala TaxID=75352 RepID=UPI0020146EA2|nr:uncharacterized protein LOC125266168 [Megalobrama amblycephala]